MFYNADEFLDADNGAARDALNNGICTIDFHKVNGDFRRMSCTLNREIMTLTGFKERTEPAKRSRTIDPEYLIVWDVEAEGYRTIWVPNIIEWSVGNNVDAAL